MSAAQPIQSPAPYPRVYRASGGWLVFLTLARIVFAAGGFTGAWFLLTSKSTPVWLAGIALAFAGLGTYCLLSTFRSRVVLFPDRIEVEELTRTRVLSREEIRGWRSMPTSPPGLVFVPKDPDRRPTTVAQVFRLDAEFAAWLDRLPCLDSEDTRASKAEIRNNPRLGATPGERMRKLARGRHIARGLTTASLLAAVWGFLYPVPYDLSIAALALLPWIALETVRRSQGLFRIDTTANDAHPNVAVAVIFPSLILMLRAVFDYEIVFSLHLIWASLGIAAMLAAAGFAVDPAVRGRKSMSASLLLFSLVYGYGAAMEANALFDHSPEGNVNVKVEAKRVVNGRTTTYQLQLAPWGPKPATSPLRVERSTFDAIQPGDVVCLTLRQGALGVKWYYMRAWQRG